MQQSNAAPHVGSSSGLPLTQRLARATPSLARTTPRAGKRMPPLCHLYGGDKPQGGSPASVGHAGLTGHYRLASMAMLALATFIVLALHPSVAHAGITIYFANGGEAELEADGSITGTAHVGDYDDELAEHFAVTMPDGTETWGWCMDYMHYTPAPGDYPFIATPNAEGSYDVVIDSRDAQVGDLPIPGLNYLSPAQRVGDFKWKPEFLGWLKLVKSSELPSITDDNDSYSLKGAKFTVWEDKACTKKVDTTEDLVTNSDGETNTVSLAPGTYWVKEEDAPKGYQAEVEPWKTTIVAKKTTTLEVSDKPDYENPEVWANKTDAEYHSPQGSTGFAGAEFTVRYYDGVYNKDTLPNKATRTWVVACDGEGNVFPTMNNLIKGDALYKDEKGNVILPLGTVTIQETKAPQGYMLEGQDENSPADYTAPIHLTKVTGTGSYKAPTIKNTVMRGGISLQKVDAQTGKNAQGDASLANIGFSIINLNDHAVVVEGAAYQPGDVIGSELITNEEGFASTSSRYLPLGTYEVRETTTNDSMLLEAQSCTVTLTEKHANKVVSVGQSMEDHVVRGGLAVGKISLENNEHTPQGEAKLEKAVFSVTLKSEKSVMVNGSVFKKGDVVLTMVTNDKGIATTKNDTLPYGTYEVREVEAPAGYLLNKDWSKTVSIRVNGEIVDLTDPSNSVADQVKRGGFSFNKVDEDSMERMSHVAWRITSDTTGEAHVLVADENGIADTEGCPHDADTNANDAAVKSDGSIDESLLKDEAGIWFSGHATVSTKPNNDLKALPYDVYTVEELRSSANEGHDLVMFKVRIHNNNRHLDMGTVDNKPVEPPSIATTLTYGDNDHVAPAQERVILTDTVSYKNLKPGEQYTLIGKLMRKDTGEPLLDGSEQPIMQAVTFTPLVSNGTTEVVFEFDATTLEGFCVVAFEELLQGGETLATHADLADKGQTVFFPSVGTTLTDAEGYHEVTISDRMTLVDTVRYCNLVPNMSYELRGTLMDKDSQEPVVGSDGNEIHCSASFVPRESEGTVTVSFAVRGDDVRGRTLVAFEQLLHAGIVLASHEDLNDIEQTITVVDIQTELTDMEGHHSVPASPNMELVDTVTYRGLTPGATYEVQGTLIDKRTGEPVVDERGNAITAAAMFVPSESVGSTSLSFGVDTTLVAGREIVAFETLYREGRELAIHADLEDRAQTVYVPDIGTILTSEAGTHEAKTGTNMFTDVVSYSGLRPDIPYTVVGVLMDANTKLPLVSASGEQIEAYAEFTPTESDGTVTTVFEVDVSSLAGTTTVAYEYLYEGSGTGGRILASHEDPTCTEQTIVIPRISTSACDASDGDKTIQDSGTAHVRDTVSYKGLEPNTTYVMSGTVYRKSIGQPLKDKSGNDVTAQVSFTPEQSDGTIELDFEFDTSLVEDEDVVVFESCTRNGTEVAVHADIEDEDQTVRVKKPKTPTPKEKEKDQKKATPKQESQAAKETQTVREIRATPSTGDVSLAPLAFALATLGSSLLIARRLLQ